MKTNIVALVALAFLVTACGSSSPGGDGRAQAQPEARILARPASIRRPSHDGASLTLLQPSDQMFRQGQTIRLTVKIDRGDFTDPVYIQFDGLPDGVKVVERDATIPVGAWYASFTLQADETADIVENHLVRVTAKTQEGLELSQIFRLTVEDKR